MKKFLVAAIVLCFVFIWLLGRSNQKDQIVSDAKRTEILKFAVLSDSENDSDNLTKALVQAKSRGAKFVIGLGDFTKLGEVKDLEKVKKVFDDSGVSYYVTSGDRDLWASRNAGENASYNFDAVFGKSSHIIDMGGIQIVIVDNSDIYNGIEDGEMSNLKSQISNDQKLVFVFAHKTPYHPQSSHVMGADNPGVKKQAEEFIKLMEEAKVDGFFSGDLHFFAQFQSPGDVVKMTTIGAVSGDRNFLGPRYAMVTVWDDGSWEAEDVAIR